METNEKTYTPDLDEFKVGFEYEYLNGKDWQPKKMNSLQHRASDSINLNYDVQLNRYKFRVRYLNESDIESIGFYNHKDKSFSTNGWWINLSNAEMVHIFHIDKDSEFKGRIKNKSELVSILKMLGWKDKE